MRLKFAAVFILTCCSFLASAQILPYASREGDGRRLYREKYDEAVDLFRNGMYARSMQLFKEIAGMTSDGDAYGYYVLNAVYLRVPGYEELIDEFVSRNGSSGLIPQIRYRYALNLFDDMDFKGAAEQFAFLSRHNLYRSQVPEFQFKRAYCDFELRYYDRAVLRFRDLTMRAHTDYTAPAEYATGYIYYEQKKFKDAVEWFGKAAKDNRFTEIASFYLLECRFMLKEYGRVVKDGPGILETVSADKKPYVARFISESWLVLGNAENAGKYFDMGKASLSAMSRSDYFYAGSVLYALKDYRQAIENFSKMTDRTDSIGQIANYNLGYCYIQTGDKVSAMGAFKDASSAGADPDIREDAFFNYAKLSFDLNADSSVFQEYLREYSDKGRSAKIYSYIALAALYGRDYAGAIDAYDQIDELDGDMKANYMKANYLRASQLMSSGSWRAAADCLRAAAYYSDRRTYFNQMSRYWLAEAYYRSGQYDMALKVLTDLYNTSALYGKQESSMIPLNIAYCYLKQNEYTAAANWFSSYLEDGDPAFRKDALLRRGDCMFMMQRYGEAIASYDQVLADWFSPDDIYPYYQDAMAYGLSGNLDRKVSLLSNVLKASPSSAFYPEAMYEYGRALVVSGNTSKAESCFNTLAANVKDSSYIAMSWIELGMIYRNRGDNAKALGYYKGVVEKMPSSEYADASLLAIESIYKTMNTPEEYLAYIGSIGRASLKSEAERESMLYNAAEQIFLSGNYPKALASLESYVSKYPAGKMVPDAEYYIGECYRQAGQPETACDHYRNAMNAPECSFRDSATGHYADLSYSMQKYAEAFSAYRTLYESAGSSSVRSGALAGLMRSAFRARYLDDAIQYAGLLTGSDDKALAREAEYVKAKSLLATSRREEAFAILAALASEPSTAEGAEASYLLIQDSYDRGAFEEVEDRVYAFSDSGTGQVYWLAKAFIVLGDAFVEMDNLEQAKATFESVAQGYTPSGDDDDIPQSVDMRLKKLSDLMSEETINQTMQ